jgi:hypothetical protein
MIGAALATSPDMPTHGIVGSVRASTREEHSVPAEIAKALDRFL